MAIGVVPSSAMLATVYPFGAADVGRPERDPVLERGGQVAVLRRRGRRAAKLRRADDRRIDRFSVETPEPRDRSAPWYVTIEFRGSTRAPRRS
jgi:hypothetical protein